MFDVLTALCSIHYAAEPTVGQNQEAQLAGWQE